MDGWQEVDALILDNKVMTALQAIIAARGCNLSGALGVLTERYGQLRAARPDDFTVSPEDYWKGFYS